MKRLLTFITALFLLVSLNGQILRYSNYVAPAGNDFCMEFNAVYEAFDTKPHADTAVFMNAMVYSLDTLDIGGGESVWDRMDFFYVFACHEADDESLINWKSPGTFDATLVSTPAWVKWQGYTGASGKYLSTNYNPTSASGNYVQTSATIGVYTRANVQDDGAIMGGSDGTVYSGLLLRSSGATISRINNDLPDYLTVANNDSRGMYIVTRRGNYVEQYKNGNSVVGPTQVNATGLTNITFYILCRNGSSTVTTNQIAVAFVMDNVSDEEAAAISTIINTYMTAIGSNVY